MSAPQMQLARVNLQQMPPALQHAGAHQSPLHQVAPTVYIKMGTRSGCITVQLYSFRLSLETAASSVVMPALGCLHASVPPGCPFCQVLRCTWGRSGQQARCCRAGAVSARSLKSGRMWATAACSLLRIAPPQPYFSVGCRFQQQVHGMDGCAMRVIHT
jgi:hypothetical protein